jgi:murein DD-endopeptidase MepM/ murein hydrolase activator NlpD
VSFLLIKSFKLNKKIFIIFIIFVILIISILLFYSFGSDDSDNRTKDTFIKWVDFNVTSEALNLTAKLDINSHNNDEEIKYNWIELLAYLACKNGGDFKNFKESDLNNLVNKIENGESITDLSKDLKFYNYYYESYSAVLGNFIGNYQIETSNEDGSKSLKENYGLKAFLPIAKNYSFSHYDDFGNSRSYGFKRTHLGNDLMGSIGTPIVAVESGVVENLGWNQYGGWRIGIRSFDTKRYYYYAHLRKNHPYAEGLEEGMTVKAGDVIGYLGMTGYSTKENVNNINVPHLHFGMQLIFDESQVDSPNEIWIDVYQIIEFLKKNRSEVYMFNKETKDYIRKYDFYENALFE